MALGLGGSARTSALKDRDAKDELALASESKRLGRALRKGADTIVDRPEDCGSSTVLSSVARSVAKVKMGREGDVSGEDPGTDDMLTNGLRVVEPWRDADGLAEGVGELRIELVRRKDPFDMTSLAVGEVGAWCRSKSGGASSSSADLDFVIRMSDIEPS